MGRGLDQRLAVINLENNLFMIIMIIMIMIMIMIIMIMIIIIPNLHSLHPFTEFN